jgi:transcriptional regulator with XRE-family HTH domain
MATICMVVLCITALGAWMVESVHERIGRELRRIREAAGLSGSAVARELGWSQPKVSRVETGRFGASLGEVAALLDFYGVAEEVRAEILSWVARHDGAAGTWVVRAGGPARRQGEVSAAETRVKALLQYQALWFPGLLQSPDYAVAIARAGRFAKPQSIADRRQARQRDLRSAQAVKYRVVIEEGALTRSPGDAATLLAQLVYASDAVDSGFVDLRIRQEQRQTAAFAAGSFVLYDFKDGPPVVLVEAQTADLYVSAEADVLSYRRLFKELEKDSLDADASRNLIEEARRRLAS